jgi:hypothetical protein
MTEEARKEEARKFDLQKQSNLQMMQNITKELQKANIQHEDSEGDFADELDDYMQESLMQEAGELGVFQPGMDAEKDIQKSI